MDLPDQDQSQNDKEEKKSDLRRLEFDLTMMQSDYSAGTRKRNEILAEITRLKKQRERLDLDISNKTQELSKLDAEMNMLQNDIKSLNKKIKML